MLLRNLVKWQQAFLNLKHIIDFIFSAVAFMEVFQMVTYLWPSQGNPIALRNAKIVCNFGLSEYKRVLEGWTDKQMDGSMDSRRLP